MIASGWREVALRYLASEWCDGPFGSGLASEHYRDEGARVVRLQNIRANAFDAADAAYIAEEYFQSELSRHSVIAGDLLVAGLGDDNNLVGRACLAPANLGQTLVKADCFRFRLEESKVDPRFVMYALSSSAERDGGLLSTGSTRQRVNLGSMAGRKVLLPDRREQERVASFLDEQTARIDALIAEKERLAELLKAVVWDEVTRAVTTGIAGAPTRPTALDWCPDVPTHWDVLLLKRLFLRTEYGLSESMDAEGNVAVLRMGNVSDGRVLMTDLKYVDAVPAELLLSPGDVLYNRTNSLAQVGKVGLVRETPETPVTFASYLVRLVPNERVVPEYLVYLLNCPDVLAIARSLALPAIGQANLNPTRYGYIRVPCPPVEEQKSIVAYLDKKVSDVSALADHATEHIARLREYRSSLISAAVTGQLDISTYKEAA